jgi:hypothetical protein
MSEELTKLLGDLRDVSADVQVSALTELSDLDGGELTEFATGWPEIETARRQWALREMIDLAEDNVELDFDRVYQHGLDDEDEQVRRDSVRGLWEYERTDLIPRLLKLLENDESAGVRAEAALALGRFVREHAVGRLRDRHFEPIEKSIKGVLADTEESTDVLSARRTKAETGD